MKLYLLSLDELKKYIVQANIRETEELMILVGENSSNCVLELIDYLNDKGITFFGGIYSRLLYENNSYSNGFIIQRYEPIYSSIVIPNLMRFKLDLSELIDSTAIILVDGLTDKMKDLTDTVYSKLGNNVTYIGGGAGYYDLQHRPCIFNNKGFHIDALYICIVKSKIKLAVSHGWKKLEGPYLVTDSNRNKLSTVDNYNAFEVYRDVIEDHEGITLNKEDFFVYAKDHPFGILKNGQTEVIVRDPIMINDDGDIICVADIPLNSELYVLKGNIDSLLNSSIEITEYCVADAPINYTPLLFDCISRAMFMEDRFGEELNNIQTKLNSTVIGALSIGEISSDKKGELIIHNKSTILGLLSI